MLVIVQTIHVYIYLYIYIEMLSRLASCRTLVQTTVRNAPLRLQVSREVQRDSRDAFFRTRSERIAERQSLKERAMAPPGPNGKNFFRCTHFALYNI